MTNKFVCFRIRAASASDMLLLQMNVSNYVRPNVFQSMLHTVLKFNRNDTSCKMINIFTLFVYKIEIGTCKATTSLMSTNTKQNYTWNLCTLLRTLLRSHNNKILNLQNTLLLFSHLNYVYHKCAASRVSDIKQSHPCYMLRM